MPRNGATTLEDYQQAGIDRLRIKCEQCGRAGVYGLRTAVERWGAHAGLPDVLAIVTADCAHREKHGGRCHAVFVDRV